MKDYVNPYEKNIPEEEFAIECFRLTLYHEYRQNGKRIKIDEPLSAECVMPLGEMFGIPRYSKEEIARILSEKIEVQLRGEE